MRKLDFISTSEAITGYTDSIIAKTERADCVVRAIASASGMTYDKDIINEFQFSKHL